MKLQEFKKLIREEIQNYLKEDEIESTDIKLDKLNVKTIKEYLRYLKSKLSPEGWDIVFKFIKGSTGWNRGYTIIQLAAIFGNTKALKDLGPGDSNIKATKALRKGDLQSYTNKSLYGLIDTGDLIQDPVTKKYKANI